MPKTPKNPLVYKEKSNNNVSKKVPVKSNDVSDVSDVSKEVTFEETPEGYPIGRTESGTGIYQSPELLEERKKMKGKYFVPNPKIKRTPLKHPIDPNGFWTSSDIKNAKKHKNQTKCLKCLKTQIALKTQKRFLNYKKYIKFVA